MKEFIKGVIREELSGVSKTEVKEFIREVIREELSGVSKTEVNGNIRTEPIPVLVCTDKRGVVFGYTSDENARPVRLSKSRMCLYWSKPTGGVFGLTDKGPDTNCKISAEAESVTLEGVTAVFSLTDAAVQAWQSAPVQGR